MTAIQMGLCVTLLVAIQTLRAALQADPVIAKYLEDMRAQLRLADGGSLDPISKECSMLDFLCYFYRSYITPARHSQGLDGVG